MSCAPRRSDNKRIVSINSRKTYVRPPPPVVCEGCLIYRSASCRIILPADRAVTRPARTTRVLSEALPRYVTSAIPALSCSLNKIILLSPSSGRRPNRSGDHLKGLTAREKNLCGRRKI